MLRDREVSGTTRRRCPELGKKWPASECQEQVQLMMRMAIHWLKEVIKGVKEDERAFIEQKCEEIDKFSDNSKKMCRIVKELNAKNRCNQWWGWQYIDWNRGDKKGVKYSTKLYDTQDHHPAHCPERTEDEPTPFRSEVLETLHQIRNGKSPGTDDIPAGLWKAGEEDILWRLCTLIWKSKEWPKDWCRVVFIPITYH